jgi:hypothetical protein
VVIRDVDIHRQFCRSTKKNITVGGQLDQCICPFAWKFLFYEFMQLTSAPTSKHIQLRLFIAILFVTDDLKT